MPISDYVQLFSSRRPQIGPLVFDASIAEQHAFDVDYTDSPIEDGGRVADHAVIVPRTLALTVIAAPAPDSFLPPVSFTRPQRLWQTLCQLAALPELVDVVTTLEIYPRMAIVRVGTLRNAENTNAMEFDVVLRRIEFARVDAATQVAREAQDLALAEQDLGAQASFAKLAPDLARIGAL